MVAFNRDDIPETVDTVEKLAVWAGTVLNNVYATETVIEATNKAQYVATAEPFWIDAAQPSTWRYIMRQSIALDPEWQQGKRLWECAEEILPNLTIPNAFTDAVA